MTKNLTIGKLAQMAQVNVETIRYYQRIGLIIEPNKPVQGYRKYNVPVADTIKFIKRSQQLGFTLKEIKELLTLGSGSCQNVQALAQIKRNKIYRQIQDLTAMQNELDVLIKSCHTNPNSPQCALIDTLSKPFNFPNPDIENT